MLKNAFTSGPKCPACTNTKIVTDQDTGELFCGNCGLVITDKVTDTNAEWRLSLIHISEPTRPY